MKLEIIHETPQWIAVNKPAGLLSIPDREGKEASLKRLLRERLGEIFTVHRLDRETSGLILFAKNEVAHKWLSAQFEERKTNKIYQGLVMGCPAEESGRIEAPIGAHPAQDGTMIVHRQGKPAETEYRVLKNYSSYGWMEFRILTGRTHQIRVHMKDLGFPIVCDPLYGDGKPVFVSSLRPGYKLSKKEEEERPILSRLALHAARLGFEDSNGQWNELEAPLPKDLRATLQQLDKRIERKKA